MRTAILTCGLFGAGVLAHPTWNNLHFHHKREAGKPVRVWNEGNVHYEEYVVEKTVFLPEGQPTPTPFHSPPELSSSPAPAPTHENNHVQMKYVPDDSEPSTQSTSQPPSESPTTVQAPAPAESTTSVQEPAPKETNTAGSNGGTCSPSNVSGGDASAWANDPCSQGESILDSFNEMRAKWIPSLANAKYTWDAQLATNARRTAVSPVVNGQNEGGATQMNHALYPGSMAQCIASGDATTTKDGLTPFEQAAKMWLCEIPQGDIGCGGPPDNGETGHADIIKDTAYTKVGCYYMDATGPSPFTGMWTCDFAR
ncbi:MAG: hypothetical protein Q9163_000706 [Psora crenata]